MKGANGGEQDQDMDGWWVDYLENEMEVALEKDLEFLLCHSQVDRDRLERVRALREWLRGCDPVCGWPLEQRLARVIQRVGQALAVSESGLGDDVEAVSATR